mmetsp:Transcript_37333/g.117446  ORF Transcript_37333/g.117446 Transcript_37333/m.117446 type:complete len:254 (+) Transcript_37333:153-914(+)
MPASLYRSASSGRTLSHVFSEPGSVAMSSTQAARSSAISRGVRVSMPLSRARCSGVSSPRARIASDAASSSVDEPAILHTSSSESPSVQSGSERAWRATSRASSDRSRERSSLAWKANGRPHCSKQRWFRSHVMRALSDEPDATWPLASVSYSAMKGPTFMITRPSTPPRLGGVAAPPAATSAAASASSPSRSRNFSADAASQVSCLLSGSARTTGSSDAAPPDVAQRSSPVTAPSALCVSGTSSGNRLKSGG